MSILNEYEEISFSDDSIDHLHSNSKRACKKPKKNPLSLKIHQLKSNPNTFDYESLLKQIEKPSKFSSASPPVVERLLFGYQLSQNKRKFLIQKKECEEKKACTFKPSIKVTDSQRSFREFYTEQQLFLAKKKEKIDNLRENNERKLRDSENRERREGHISPGSKLIIKRFEKEAKESFRTDSSTGLSNSESFKKSFLNKWGKCPLSLKKIIDNVNK